jgi:methylated-DNA-[protein]-cysteine S-methyltransferase
MDLGGGDVPVAMTAGAVTVATPDGPFTVIAERAAVIASGWTDDSTLLFGLAGLREDAVRLEWVDAPSVAAEAVAAVAAFYAGDLDAPSRTPVRQRTGDFHRRVREALRATRPGDRLTYAELAARAGNPAAARAAAATCARNATALFVPCHRVLRTGGALGGFRYGLDVKRALLDREAR